jgi:hypothetical protein
LRRLSDFLPVIFVALSLCDTLRPNTTRCCDQQMTGINVIEIDGEGLTVADLVRIGYDKATVSVTPAAWKAVTEGRQVIDDILTYTAYTT